MGPISVLLVTDSRGRGAQPCLESHPTITLSKITKAGATLSKLLREAVSATERDHFDLVFVAGGICDFTKRERQHGIELLTYDCTEEERRSRANDLARTLNEARTSLGRKLVLATVIPASLKNYTTYHNRSLVTPRPQLEAEQLALEADVNNLNNIIKANNSGAARKTLDWARFVKANAKKRKRKGSKLFKASQSKFNPTHLPDGVHFDQILQEKCNTALSTVIISEALGISEQEDTDSSEGTVEGNFKRARRVNPQPSTSRKTY